MQLNEEARYRLRLAEGFLDESRQDIASRRWRSCVDDSQLAVENAAKAVLALLGPVGRTHDPAVLLRRELAHNRFPQSIRAQVERISECAELLGPDVHVESDYGDESGRRTPWEIFGEPDAKQALMLAEEAVSLARGLIRSP